MLRLFPAIHTLDLSNIEVNNKAMKVISYMPNLRDFHTFGHPFENQRVVAVLARMTGLTSLHLRFAEVNTTFRERSLLLSDSRFGGI